MLGKLRLSILAACSLVMASCGAALVGTAIDTAVSVTRPAAAVGDKVVLEGTRGLVLANNAYQGTMYALAPLVEQKRFPPATVNRIEQINERVYVLLNRAPAGLSIAQRVAEITNLTNELSLLAGR